MLFASRNNSQNPGPDPKHSVIVVSIGILIRGFEVSFFLLQKEPTLKFLTRKNPHNSRWGDMKLFLRLQVEQRALEIWKDEETLENEHEKREQKRDQAKVKKFNKKLKALRMQVRGSLYKKDISNHEHEYGEEVYDAEEDEYSRTCKTCNHVHTYEKM